MNFKLYLIAFFISLGFYASAQNGIIKGTATDQNSKESLQAVTVEIKTLHMGTQTTPAGYFEFKNIPKGSYEVSFTYLGYKTLTKQIDIGDGETKVINISLTEGATQLNEVSVKGTSHESDVTARKKEKNSGNLVNVISAQTIARSSDLNVADVTSRISGVTLDRSTDSKGEYVIVRGLEQRYNNTLINGIKVPSTDATSRSVPLQIIPSDLVGNLVVSKSLTPDMEEDAIGGTVDVQMKDAPSEPLLEASLAGGYNSTLFKRNFATFDYGAINPVSPGDMHPNVPSTTGEFPTVSILTFKNKSFVPANLESLSFGRRFFQNKFGFIFSATNQTFYTGSSSKYQDYYNDPQNNYAIQDIFDRTYSTQSNNLGFNAKADYVIDQKNKISVTGIYLRSTDISARVSIDTNFTGGSRNGPGTGRIDSAARSQYYQQTLYSAALQGKHSFLKTFTFNWTGSYAVADAATPDQGLFDVYGSKTQKNGPYQDGGLFVGGMTQIWQKNSDKDYTGKGDLLWAPHFWDSHLAFQAGGLYRSKSRDNFTDQFNFNDANIPQRPFTSLAAVSFTINPALGLGKYNPENYQATEQITAYYIESKFHFGKLEGIAGVRDAITSESNSYLKIDPGFPPYTDNHYYDYNDILPSVNLKYSITDKQDIRLSAYKAISRPNYFELVPYVSLGSGTGTSFDSKGNPDLRKARADNYDIRYDFFPNAEDEILVGVYYKKIYDPIERTLITVGNYGPTYEDVNGPTATNYGFEFNGIKYFGNFGISGNYTYTQSQLTDTKYYYQSSIVNGGLQVTRVNINENRPLQGQSKHVLNASLIYRDVKHKFNLNVSYLFQGRRIDQTSPAYQQDIYQSNFTTLSVSGDKAIGKIFTVFIKADNLTNSPFELYSGRGSFVQRDYFGQDYLIGIRAKVF